MKNVILFFSFVLSLGCEKGSEKICHVTDPLNDLSWLKEKKLVFDMDMSMYRQRISLFKYNNLSVFKIDDCVNCPDAYTIVYNCEGNKICEFGGIAGLNTCPDFDSKAVLINTLYNQ